jgi:hypothetical protein
MLWRKASWVGRIVSSNARPTSQELTSKGFDLDFGENMAVMVVRIEHIPHTDGAFRCLF